MITNIFLSVFGISVLMNLVVVALVLLTPNVYKTLDNTRNIRRCLYLSGK